MIENNIKKTILKYKELIPKNIFQRDLKVHDIKFDKANVIVGPRRSGKTFFLYDLARKQKKSILINFEDNLLGELKSSDLNKILDCSKELFEKELLCFFLDEIQNVDGWEKFVVSLLNEHYPVYVTGSNSKLLSREIATSLRGKALPYLMLPLSFKECLRFKGVVPEKNYEYADQAFVLKKHFNEYFKYGGFPEILLSDSLYLKNKLVNNYFDSVVYKDLVDRLNLKNIRLVEITIKYLLNIYGYIFSISAFERYLKSNKIPYSLEDLYNILKALQDVFMVNYVKEYSKSFKKSDVSKSKVYLFDTGYIHFLSNEPDDYGRVLENIVFVELFRRQDNIENKNIFYYKSKSDKECDFVITNRDKVYEAIQVTYDLNEMNREREINGLLSAAHFFKLKDGLILTYGQDDEYLIDGVKIRVIPVWKWLLDNL